MQFNMSCIFLACFENVESNRYGSDSGIDGHIGLLCVFEYMNDTIQIFLVTQLLSILGRKIE